MDDELLGWLYHRLLGNPSRSHTAGCTYSDALIVFIFLFGVIGNHSSRWACHKRHWPLWCRRLRFPSYSQLCRRLKSGAVQRLLEQINEECKAALPRSGNLIADGKPLVVGGFSKDPDATVGKVPDGFARGYRVHVIADSSRIIEGFEVSGLHAGEATVMRQLLPRVDVRGKTIDADANYDSNPLYRQVANQHGRLIAPRRKPGRGLGHHPQHPHRLGAIAELEQSPDRRAEHRRRRNHIERIFAHLTNLPCGLWALPNFVRRLPRVRTWILAKIILYHINELLQQALHHAP